MSRNTKNLKAFIHELREMNTRGSLKTTDVAQLTSSVRTLRRALGNNDHKLIQASVNELCRLFLKTLENNDQNDATDA
jgi:hypothetical protein